MLKPVLELFDEAIAKTKNAEAAATLVVAETMFYLAAAVQDCLDYCGDGPNVNESAKKYTAGDTTYTNGGIMQHWHESTSNPKHPAKVARFP